MPFSSWGRHLRCLYSPNQNRKGICESACKLPSLYNMSACWLYLIRAISTRILLVAKTAGGISFSLATFCLAVSSLPYRTVWEGRSQILRKQLYITHRYNCYKNKSYHLPDLSNNTKTCNPLIPPHVFQSYSGTSIQNNSVIFRAVQASCPNTGQLWFAGWVQFRDILPIPEKLTSSSFSRDETPGSWGFKGDLSGERPGTLTKNQV